MRLANKVALITGGGSGLGLAVAQAFLREGASVTIMDRSEQRVQAFCELSGQVDGIVGDVSNSDDHREAAKQVVERWGGLDIYVGNAGIWDYSKPSYHMSLENIDNTFDELMGINVKGYILGARASLAALVKRKGCMLFTLSNASFYPDGGGVLYTASKHAALGVVRQLAFEYAPHVRVNGVAPGAMDSDLRGPHSLNMSERSIHSIPIDNALAGNLPIDHWASPEECAAAYVYLASSSESGYATGSVLQVDGGFGVRGLGRARLGDGLSEWSDEVE